MTPTQQTPTGMFRTRDGWREPMRGEVPAHVDRQRFIDEVNASLAIAYTLGAAETYKEYESMRRGMRLI